MYRTATMAIPLLKISLFIFQQWPKGYLFYQLPQAFFHIPDLNSGTVADSIDYDRQAFYYSANINDLPEDSAECPES